MSLRLNLLIGGFDTEIACDGVSTNKSGVSTQTMEPFVIDSQLKMFNSSVELRTGEPGGDTPGTTYPQHNHPSDKGIK